MSSPLRTKILAVVAIALAAAVALKMFWPDGTITVDFKNAPLSKVMAAIARQGRVSLSTNLDPQTPVTLRLRHAPLMDALETLAVRVEADVRPALVGAPTRQAAREMLAAMESRGPQDQWAVSFFPAMGMVSPGTPVDPRSLQVALDANSPKDLQALLQQVAAKSGIMTAVPKDWNPEPSGSQKPGRAIEVASALIKGAKGEAVETIFLAGRPQRPPDTAGGPPQQRGEGPGRWEGGGGGWRGARGMNPEWIAARADAVIAQLPPDQRQQAQAEVDSMRAMWLEVRNLPEDQRREKMQEIFSRPDVQDRMADREAARDARRTPEQRSQRYRDYVERREQQQKGSR